MSDDRVTSYSPPNNLSDFNKILRTEWSTLVSGYTDYLLDTIEQCQYYNLLGASPAGPVVRQEIMWNAFPGNQLRRWGRRSALLAADQLLPLAQRWDRPAQYWRGGQGGALFYRPQDEYCEWRVARNDEGHIGRVVFTSEPPEYFQALCGDELVWDDESESGKVHFTGDRKLLVELYQ